jgi:acyl-CoA thioesterase I
LRQFFYSRSVTAALALAGAFGAFAPAGARADDPAQRCEVPIEVVRFASSLPRFSQKLAAGLPITVVAIGSSSTAGHGASATDKTYPSRLAAELAGHFPRGKITVLNHGVGGEEAREMVARFDKAVIGEQPDLVLWQLGTNSLLRDHPFTNHGEVVRDGLKKIRSVGADTILIDPQFAPKVIAKPDTAEMVGLIAALAKEENVALFHRFDVMKRWHTVDKYSFDSFVSSDGLHMNDWSYGCIAKALGAAIAEAAMRPVASAAAAPKR